MYPGYADAVSRRAVAVGEVLEFARVERHVVKARVELALPPQGRPTACSLENTGIAEVHHGG